MTKKILIFSTAYFPLVGGAEVAVKEITDRIDDVQFDLITARINRKLPKFERIGNVNVYRIGFGIKLDKFLLPILGVFRAVKLNKINKYNLIWSLMASQASVAASFLKILYPKIKLLLNLQEGDEEDHLKRYVFENDFLYKILIKPWYILVFKKADFITALSSYLKQRAVDIGVKCPIEIVPNGVDINKFRNPKPEIQNESKILITTSRLVKKNAVDDIIEAMKYLPDDVNFYIIGSGPLENKLKQKTKDKKLETRVKFFGYLSHEEIIKYLYNSAIFIRPSLSEGMGISFLEAMAMGVPVIATPVGGIPDFLEEGETGLFCNVRDPESIAEKVKIYFENADLREKIKANAKEMVEKKYDWNLIADKMKNIFNKLCVS